MIYAELIAAAMKNGNLKTYADLARASDIDASMITRWTKEPIERAMQMDQALILCTIARLPALQTIANLRPLPTKNRQVAKLLRRVASAAAAIVIGLVGLPQSANANCVQIHKYNSPQFDIIAQNIHSRKSSARSGTGRPDSCLAFSTHSRASCMKIRTVDCVCRPDPSTPSNPCFKRVWEQLAEGKFELTNAWTGWKIRGDGKLVGPDGVKFSPVHLQMLWKLRRDLLDAMIADAFDGPTVLNQLADRWNAGLDAANDDNADSADAIGQAFLSGIEPAYSR